MSSVAKPGAAPRPGTTRSGSTAPFGFDASLAAFDRATRLAQSMFAFSGASIILVHEGEVWRSRFADILPSEDPGADEVMKSGEMLWIEDTLLDPRSKDNRLVIGPPFIRFTVAVPIRLQDGTTPGVLSVSGREPHAMNAEKAARLKDIADFIADEWTRTRALAALEKSLQERDQALERIERSEERLNIALALADVHVWELDYVQRKLFKSGAEDTFFPKPHTFESLHKDLYVTVDPRDRQAAEAAWKDHLENGTPYRPEHRINRDDGREVWAQSALKPIAGKDGRVTRIVGAVQNITARKRFEQAMVAAKEEADAANKAKSEFLASMSHELRTPLNAILGFAEIIREQLMGPLPAMYAGYAGDIYASGRHLLDLVNDILDIAKLEAGKVELHESEFDMDDLMAETLPSFGRRADAANVRILPEHEGLPIVRADRRLMKQILLNLISNALKFTPPGGSVSVAAKRMPGTGLELIISDSGVGMSVKEIEVALTPFGQVDSRIAHLHKGTGLGLPISRSLARLHGGDLRIESEPGNGTRAIVSLPESRVVAPRMRERKASIPR